MQFWSVRKKVTGKYISRKNGRTLFVNCSKILRILQKTYYDSFKDTKRTKMLFVHHLKYYKFYLKKRRKKERKIFTIFEKYVEFLERVEKVGSWIIDYPAMLSTWPAIEQRVDRPSSPCVAYFHYVRLCQAGVRKGGGAKKGNNAVRRHLSPSPRFSPPPPTSSSPHFPPFDFSFCLVRVSRTRARPAHPPCFSYPFAPIVNVSLLNPPSFFPSKYPRRVFHSSRFFFSRNNRRNTHPHCSQFLFRVMRQPFLFIPFSPLSTFRSFFLSFLTRRKVQAISRENKREDSALVRKGESKEEALGE